MQKPGIKVDQKPDGLSGCFQIRENLGLKNAIKPFHALDFDDYGVFDEQINPIFTKNPAFVPNWKRNLPSEMQPGIAKLDAGGLFVRGL